MKQKCVQRRMEWAIVSTEWRFDSTEQEKIRHNREFNFSFPKNFIFTSLQKYVQDNAVLEIFEFPTQNEKLNAYLKNIISKTTNTLEY